MNVYKNQVYRMEAGSANSDYYDFQVLAYHRDFTMTIFLCECFLRLREGCYMGCYRNVTLRPYLKVWLLSH